MNLKIWAGHSSTALRTRVILSEAWNLINTEWRGQDRQRKAETREILADCLSGGHSTAMQCKVSATGNKLWDVRAQSVRGGVGGDGGGGVWLWGSLPTGPPHILYNDQQTSHLLMISSPPHSPHTTWPTGHRAQPEMSFPLYFVSLCCVWQSASGSAWKMSLRPH